jgi:hypothetical protein
MAITVNGYNIGTDASFAITDQYGDIFLDSDMGYLMDFDSESEDSTLKVVPITTGGLPIYQTIWSGVTGSLMFTRFGPSFQQMMMYLMATYYNSGVIPQFSLALLVRNRNGSTDQYRYAGFQFSRPKFCNFRATKEVDMRSYFKASSVQAFGALTPFLKGLPAFL